ncbi:hypothetical protein B0H13DRAFT_2365914 [Mycena leptocephala]|nr:hypothetical protein B0H13DRAFT_2365914 [Mycena leptocephala]
MRMRAFAGSNSAAPPPHSGILPLGLGGTTSRLWCPTRLSGISLAEASPTERRVSIRGTDQQIGEALIALGKRFLRKRVRAKKVHSRAEVEDGEDQTGNVDAEFGTKTILDAEAGYFGKEHNRVEEEDARNATELIQKFRSKREKNKSPNNAVQPVSPSRNSLGRGGTSSPSSPIMKKREGEKNGGNEGRAKRARTEYRDELAWDRRIKCIDAVEWAGQTLYIYFTLHGGEHMTEDWEIFRQKFPQMHCRQLIDFYQSNRR